MNKEHCSRSLNISKERVMKHTDYREFGLKCGIPIKSAWHKEEDGVFSSTMNI